MRIALCLFVLASVLLSPGAALPQPGGGSSDVWVYLERTAGIYFTNGEPLGPVYHITIFGDGTVRYVGEAGVRVRGERRSKVAVRDVVDCINEAARQGFFDWEPLPRAMHPFLQLTGSDRLTVLATGVLDSPGVAIQISLNGEQTWREPTLPPPWFRELVRRIDGLVESEHWIE